MIQPKHFQIKPQLKKSDEKPRKNIFFTKTIDGYEYYYQPLRQNKHISNEHDPVYHGTVNNYYFNFYTRKLKENTP